MWWKTVKKVFIKLVISIIFVGGMLYAFLYWSFHNNIDSVLNDNQKTWLINEMKHTPELPEKIYSTMLKYFPDFYSENSWNHKVKKVIGIKPLPCQCADIYLPYIPGEDKTHNSTSVLFHQNDLIVKLYMEKHFSQKDCFTFNMNISEFGPKLKGISEAAKYYFNKELSTLTEEEIIGLYVIHKAPGYYNPINRKEKFDQAVDAIIKNRSKE